eukprot:TRINITY_DN6849_c0_g1_i14.p1 TRINITY_DN6849_c0_g1~~TRINITY_DN6849_c0_g1_i14.p1  ORF type:complete len:385 (-),score=58.31 TRINITY_DN6849_c0_g1_i14:1140-2294(-)
MLYHVESGQIMWLRSYSDDPVVTNAVWCPTQLLIAYVVQGNLMIYDVEKNTSIGVTTDGDSFGKILNGVHSWAYEEEIFADYNALWWSPLGDKITFFRANQTVVPVFNMPLYKGVRMEFIPIPYPQPGDNNPQVSVHVYNLKERKLHVIPNITDEYFTLLLWNSNDSILIRTLNRLQNKEKFHICDVTKGVETSVVSQEQTSGWVESRQDVVFVDSENLVYVANNSGYYHLSLFRVSDWSFKFLTSGEWDVISILGVSAQEREIFYTSSEPDPTEKHIYAVNWNTFVKRRLTDGEGYYNSLFNKDGSHYILNYQGPSVPSFSLWKSTNPPEHVRTLEDNSELKSLIQQYLIPTKTFMKVPGVGSDLNAYVWWPWESNSDKKSGI